MPAIAICAPSTPMLPEDADRVVALAAAEFPDVKLHFHPQCFRSGDHFAGPDEVRLSALIECANDPAFDALWFARGGHGPCRLAEPAVAGLGPAARDNHKLANSDAGYLLGSLSPAGTGQPVHAAMPTDIRRAG